MDGNGGLRVGRFEAIERWVASMPLTSGSWKPFLNIRGLRKPTCLQATHLAISDKAYGGANAVAATMLEQDVGGRSCGTVEA